MKKRWCLIWSPHVAPSSFQPSLEAQRDGAAYGDDDNEQSIPISVSGFVATDFF